MTASISVKFENEFSSITIDDDGFVAAAPWAQLVAACREAAVKNEHDFPFETGAVDATETLTFTDQSQLMIANPRQSCFAGFVRALK